MLIALICAVAWGIGAAMKAPYRARWIMIAGLLGAVLVIHLVLPDGHSLRQALGVDPTLGAIVLAAGALIWVYARWVGRLRARSQAQAAFGQTQTATAQGAELDRVARHIVLREVGGPGQQRLRKARVLVIGAGGLGAPAMLYMAAGGVGTIGVIDDDIVENSNLHRQVIHRDTDIGIPKVFSAKAALEAQNPFLTVLPYHQRLTADNATQLFADFDLILDGSDNFETRSIINAAAVACGIPVVWAALSQWEGQLTIFDPARNAPCFACIFPDRPADGLAPNCAQAGVFGPLPGVVGTMMATEAMKLISKAGTPLLGQLVLYDALESQSRKIKISRRAECPVCGS